jgi:hypothetical protein
MHGVGRQRLGGADEGWIDTHSPRVASKHGDHRRIRKAARHLRRPQEATSFGLNDRHPMKPDLAAGGSDAAHRAHQRVDAGRQAFSNVRARIASRVEPSDDACDPQPPQNVAKDHRGDDIAAARIEKNDAPQLGVSAARFEEIDKGLRRLSLDDAVSNDDVGTMFAALSGFEGRDVETHRRPAFLGHSRHERDRDERDRPGQRQQSLHPPVAGGR